MSKINSVDANEYQEVKQRLKESGKKKGDFKRLLGFVAVAVVFQLGIAAGILISTHKEGPHKEQAAAVPQPAIPPLPAAPVEERKVDAPTMIQQNVSQPKVVPAAEVNPPTPVKVKVETREKPASRESAPVRRVAAPKKKRVPVSTAALFQASPPPLSIDVAGGDIGRAYAAGMRTIIERHKESPSTANGNVMEGRCLIVCIIKRDGTLKHAEIIRTSGNSVLDAAALRSVHKAGRFPAVPEVIPGEELSFDVPLTFRQDE